ncbi:hypothetical protein [Marinibacterium profundimaris]|uniref:Uncharacterized protein n=1 Tax=Marinibacterium profundimaris TaxID=1679460 RepID=A0A225NGP1_9RHOB|nr:hypothetical protein [Marinibacterium profundimaris]OWU72844.1 hypothetical protein ATO3_14165 [Marinibacterium profundimaris]
MKLLGVVVILGAAAYALSVLRPDLAARILSRSAEVTTDPPGLTDASTRDETERGTISYLLDTRRWTTFSLPGRLQALRILAHPDVAPDHEPVPGEAYRYGIEIEVLDGAGQVLRRIDRHFRTELVVYRDVADGAEVVARRYSDDPALPLAVDRLILGLEDLPEARAVRLRSAHADAPLTGVNVRLYRPRPYNEGNVNALWERLAPTERRALAVGYVYPPEYLTAEERLAILSHRWLPFGPVGIEPRDYVSRRLEIYDPPGARVVPAETTLRGGIYLDPQRRAGVLLPEDFEVLQITATRPAALLDDEGLSGSPITFHAAVERPFDTEPRRFSFATNEKGTAALGGLPGGRLILSADEPAWIRIASLDAGGETRVLTEELPRIRYQIAEPGAPLVVQTAFGLPEPVPVRLDLRVFGGGTRRVTLTMRDAAGEPVAERIVPLAGLLSEYDRLTDTPQQPLSDAETLYLALSPEVAELEIAADAHIVAAVYMRPVGVPRRIDVPEDYFARSATRGGNQSWFGVRAEARPGQGHVMVERPVRAGDTRETTDPDTLDWEDFTPLGDWIARRALIPRPSDGLGLAGRAVFYQPVAPGEAVPAATRADFEGPPVLIVPPRAEPAAYRVLADGQEIWRAELPGNAWANLPLLPEGTERIVVEGPGRDEVLLSGLALNRAGYIERRLLRFPPGRSGFTVEKRSAAREVLAIRVFPATAAETPHAARAEMAVTLDFDRVLNTPITSWTDQGRSFNIRLDGSSQGAILEQTGLRLGAEQRMFVVLGEDMPPGRYDMTVDLDHDAELLVLISRALPRTDGQIVFRYDSGKVGQ